MKSTLAILCCVFAVSAAQLQNRPRQDVIYQQLSNGRTVCRLNCRRPLNDCPIVNCPIPDQPAHNPQCPIPDCSTNANRHHVFPSVDPNFFYQCAPKDALTWEPLLRQCGCETLFDYGEQRCVHPHEFDTTSYTCSGTTNPRPKTKECPIECPTCDENGGGGGPVTDPIIIITPDPETTTPGGGGDCNCCIPCVWWPCASPCLQAANCPCRDQQINQNNPNNPNNPWQNDQNQWQNNPNNQWQNDQNQWQNNPNNQWQNDQWNRQQPPRRQFDGEDEVVAEAE